MALLGCALAVAAGTLFTGVDRRDRRAAASSRAPTPRTPDERAGVRAAASVAPDGSRTTVALPRIPSPLRGGEAELEPAEPDEPGASDDGDPPPRTGTARVNGPHLIAHYPGGQLHFEGHQVPGEDGTWVREGNWAAWHENGQLHELGGYRAGVEHGPWQWWYENGERMAEGRFVEGELEGPWSYWYESGRLQMTGSYVQGVGHGPWVHYHENGLRQAAGSFRSGEISGRWTFWHPDGSLDTLRTGEYVDGARSPD